MNSKEGNPITGIELAPLETFIKDYFTDFDLEGEETWQEVEFEGVFYDCNCYERKELDLDYEEGQDTHRVVVYNTHMFQGNRQTSIEEPDVFSYMLSL